jgi:ATP-binding cassette, subfamily A (ABC1), member 3
VQVVSGVSMLAYWSSTWLWDFACFQVPLWTIVVLIKIFNVKALIKGENGAGLISLLILYGASINSFTQLFSFLFDKHSQAQVTIALRRLGAQTLYAAQSHLA